MCNPTSSSPGSNPIITTMIDASLLQDLLIGPFVEFDFMRRALAGVLFLSLSAAPIGVLLMLRRMSLMGDAISHAVLPGVAAGYMLAGFNITAMGLGGLIAGLVVALGVGLASRYSSLKEDANFAAFYLTCLAIGVLMVSRQGSQVDLLHLLFGSVLAVDVPTLTLVAGVASITLVVLALIYRPLLVQIVDPVFLQAVGARGTLWHVLFLMLVVLNLVAGFQALGTLMAVGLMMLPAITARLWRDRMGAIMLLAVLIALVCGYGGLLLSFHVDLPSGPAIILLCGGVYLFSLFFASQGGMIPRWLSHRHHQRAGFTPDRKDAS
ncbi:MAG: hypothetical protein RL244_2205 [Pseudomonadota bacterium]|jgi:zinc/manganese transport system permease protein